MFILVVPYSMCNGALMRSTPDDVKKGGVQVDKMYRRGNSNLTPADVKNKYKTIGSIYEETVTKQCKQQNTSITIRSVNIII